VYLYLPLNEAPRRAIATTGGFFSPSRLSNKPAGTVDHLPEAGCSVRQRPRSSPREHYSWAELMHRMFSVDVLECVACGSRIRIVSAIHPPEAIRKSLDCLGIPSAPHRLRRHHASLSDRAERRAVGYIAAMSPPRRAVLRFAPQQHLLGVESPAIEAG
jgi:hypothetical protein